MLVTARIASIFVSSTAVYIYDFLEVRYTSLRLLWDKVILAKEETHFFNLSFMPWQRYVVDMLRIFCEVWNFLLSMESESFLDLEKEWKKRWSLGKIQVVENFIFFFSLPKIADYWVKCWPAIFSIVYENSFSVEFREFSLSWAVFLPVGIECLQIYCIHVNISCIEEENYCSES